MSFQLQPDMKRLEDNAVPTRGATETVFTYPESTSKNYGDYSSRPNTMLYGTAPFMAGKGSPAAYIDVSDELRPQSTTRFGKIVTNNYEKQIFPIDNSMPTPPLPSLYEPRSSRAELQNDLFDMRYNKNINN
jgi:hypothetical protein